MPKNCHKCRKICPTPRKICPINSRAILHISQSTHKTKAMSTNQFPNDVNSFFDNICSTTGQVCIAKSHNSDPVPNQVKLDLHGNIPSSLNPFSSMTKKSFHNTLTTNFASIRTSSSLVTPK